MSLGHSPLGLLLIMGNGGSTKPFRRASDEETFGVKQQRAPQRRVARRSSPSGLLIWGKARAPNFRPINRKIPIGRIWEPQITSPNERPNERQSASCAAKPIRLNRFRSLRLRAGPVAQWLEPAAHNGLVAGSSPARPTTSLAIRPK